MAVQVLWILLTFIEVVYLEQPVFVPSAAELSDVPPENKHDWLHPVIFEPQNKIQLTCSTYQVTTFLDFEPFMNGFIKSFKADGSNPAYFSKIKHKSTNTGLMEIDYFDELFDVIYRKFLNTIDHIEYQPTLQNKPSSETRGKRSILFSETGSYSTFSRSLMPTEELFLDKLLVALENMNSTLPHKCKRMKQYSILTWVFRWGVFSNV